MSTWIDSQPDAYLMCRDTGIRHSWQPHTAEIISGGRGGYIEGLKCDRCGAIKTRKVDRRGIPISGHTEYPDGYLRQGMGRATRADNAKIRVAHLQRTVSNQKQEAPARRRTKRRATSRAA
jgi:hypothetical protein